eukprot:gb/GEZN01013937.1/.p1 GENE.gb/GEZN01013937.1/~~gb/GEZN01013937.1/.p1  ORF type:complete len:246 (-),score=49.60 gb/GEZN01013937.1/:189-926(-)
MHSEGRTHGLGFSGSKKRGREEEEEAQAEPEEKGGGMKFIGSSSGGKDGEVYSQTPTPTPTPTAAPASTGVVTTKVCISCSEEKEKSEFSTMQLRSKNSSCKACIQKKKDFLENRAAAPTEKKRKKGEGEEKKELPESLKCSSCKKTFPASGFSKRQLTKPPDQAKCTTCAGKLLDKVLHTNWPCSDCHEQKPKTEYSLTQKQKGSGKARCHTCVEKMQQSFKAQQEEQGVTTEDTDANEQMPTE